MKKFHLKFASSLLLLLANAFISCAHADVLVDLAQEDEIVISNTQQNGDYTFKLEEPREQVIVASNEPSEVNLNGIKIERSIKNTGHLPFNREVQLAANKAEIEPGLLHAVIAVESNHNPRAKSAKGAYGLMQLMPATAKRFNVKNRNDPKQNILAGAMYLRELLTLFNGDIKLTLAAYNAGPYAVMKYHNRIPPYKETQQYVPKVLKMFHRYT